MSFQVFSRRDVTLVFMLFSSLDVELNAPPTPPFWDEDVVDEFEIEWEENMYECWFLIPNIFSNMRIFTYQDTKNGMFPFFFKTDYWPL